MSTYPFAGEIKMTKVIKNGQEVIEWEPVDERERLAQPREWVGLTDEEISRIEWRANETLDQYARHIEAKLKEKNA